MTALRIALAVLGAAIVITTWLSIARTLVVPRGGVSFLLRAVDRIVDSLYRRAVARIDSYHRRDSILASQAPVQLASLLFTWIILMGIGYALMLAPTGSGPGDLFREAGSSLFTLGFAGHEQVYATVVDFLAAASGLIVVALQISYLPTLYSAYNRRETEITLLGVRAGRPAWGPELLARAFRFGLIDSLPELYSSWERWSADVAESHSNYPVLIRFRSPTAESSWLIGMLAVLDAAALHLALDPESAPFEARLCLQMGFTALRAICESIGVPVDRDPRPDAPLRLTRDEFDEGVALIASSGFPTERSGDEAFADFAGWRVN
jgi:hypothetical protein